MLIEKFKLPVHDELISGIIISEHSDGDKPQVAYFHGAGQKTSYKELIYDYAPAILRNHKTLLSIDFSGRGESSGDFKKGSLKKRVIEASTAITRYVQEPLTLIGSSMGGHIVLKLLEYVSVDTLILFCPAVYAAAAYDVPFDQGFSEIIRIPESWRTTDVIEPLRAFTGNLLVIIGDKDDVIPPQGCLI